MQRKILILGGANLHCKLVTAAREMGLYTVVTDYLDECDSPAKQIADKNFKIDVNDTESIVRMCKQEHVDAVLSTHLDACQRAYYKICQELELPCYITDWNQVFTLTNKTAFKECCRKYGVGIIEEYSVEQIEKSEEIVYPVLAKPSYSRGSRGQTLCKNKEEVFAAVKAADQESFDKGVVIERYLENAADIAITYFFIEGKAYLIRVADRKLGPKEYNLDRISKGTIAPSEHLEEYLQAGDTQMVEMLKGLGIKNGPVFLQALVRDGNVYFYDTGFRFSGTEYTTMFNDIFQIDIHKMMIEFSLSGHITENYGLIQPDAAKLGGKSSLSLYPLLKAGTIDKIEGMDLLSSMPEVLCHTIRCKEGERVRPVGDIRQCFAEIGLVADNSEKMRNAVNRIQEKMHVIGRDGEEMICDSLEF